MINTAYGPTYNLGDQDKGLYAKNCAYAPTYNLGDQDKGFAC